METINVFGGTGFVGSQFVKNTSRHVIKSLRDDHTVHADNILYFISTVDNYNVFNNLHIDVDTNLTVLLSVLNNIPVEKRQSTTFNFVSSWFVYGNGPKTMEAHETDYCDPKGFYSITKRAAEQLLISFCETYGMKYRIFRLSNVVGNGDSKTSRKKNAIGYLVNELSQNNPVSLYECGKVYRDLIHVNDCINAIDLVLDKGEVNAIYNISNGVPIELSLFIETAKNLINSTSEISCMETPAFHKQVQVDSMYLNNTKLKQLGYKQQYSIIDIINDIISK